MYFREIGHNRYAVLKNKDDDKFYGTVAKQEYVSIDMDTGRRITRRFWKTDTATAGGWRQKAKDQFPTREAAGESILSEASRPYSEKRTRWNKQQNNSASKAARSGV
jgi:hypothetical protein